MAGSSLRENYRMNTAESNSRIQTTCVIILATVAAGFAMWWLRGVLIPFVVAVFVMIGLTPMVSLLRRRLRFPKVLAVFVTLIFAVVVLSAVGVVIANSLGGVSEYAETSQVRIELLLNKVADALPLDRLNLEREDILQPFSNVRGQDIHDLVVGVGDAVSSLVSDGVLVVIFLGFLMFAGTSQSEGKDDQWNEIQSTVSRYIVTKTFISAVTGLLTTVILWAMGVELAVLLGLLAFLLNFIPSIGSIVGALLPLPILLMSPDVTMAQVVLTLALLGGMQFTIGNIIEPKLMGKRTGLHPIVVLLSLMFWGMLWGIIGMFLAVPMTAVIKIILDKHERSRPVANLLSGHLKPEKA
jgi:AI-2 transport protein TqsA